MANTQTDTPVIKMTAASIPLIDETDVNYFHWISKGATVGDDLLVVDGDGNTLWEEVADVVNLSKMFVIKNKVKGLTISVIDSGTLYVIRRFQYLKPFIRE